MLGIPSVAGIVAARVSTLGLCAALSCCWLGAFLFRTPLQALMLNPHNRRALVSALFYGTIAAIGFTYLLTVHDRWWLLLFATFAGIFFYLNVWFSTHHRQKSAANEILGVMALCMGAPAAYYTVSGSWSQTALWIWFWSVLYFVGPIFHIKMILSQVANRARPRAILGDTRTNFVYHAVAFIAAVYLASHVTAGPLLIIPYGVSLVKTMYMALRPQPRLDLKRLGWSEVGFSLIFAALLIAAYSV